MPVVSCSKLFFSINRIWIFKQLVYVGRISYSFFKKKTEQREEGETIYGKISWDKK